MTTVYYSSSETGAPTLNNVAGSMINVLDACLINGFNSKSVTSIVVASEVATATISAHGYETGRKVTFAGATPSGLNGPKEVTATGTNTVTFAAPGISDGSATGTLTSVRTPLGWTKAYSGTNKAIYQRSDVLATAMLLRVDDTQAGDASTINARAVMVESASGIDTFTAASPLTTMISGGAGYYWPKGTNNSTAKPWLLIGDGLTFYFLCDDANYTYATTGGLHACVFGDIKPYRSADAYHCLIAGNTTTSGTNTFNTAGAPALASASNCLARPSTQLGSAVPGSVRSFIDGVIGAGASPIYPSPVDNGMVLSNAVYVQEQNSSMLHPIRGELRGVKAPLASVPTAMHGQVLTDVTGFTGRLLIANLSAQGAAGALVFDIANDWG